MCVRQEHEMIKRDEDDDFPDLAKEKSRKEIFGESVVSEIFLRFENDFEGLKKSFILL